MSGVYRFEIGLYHNFSLERLPVIIGEANQPPDDRIILGKFHVQLHPPSPPEYPVHAQFGDADRSVRTRNRTKIAGMLPIIRG